MIEMIHFLVILITELVHIRTNFQAIHFDVPTTCHDLRHLEFTLNRMLPDDLRLYNISEAPKGTAEQESNGRFDFWCLLLFEAINSLLDLRSVYKLLSFLKQHIHLRQTLSILINCSI